MAESEYPKRIFSQTLNKHLWLNDVWLSPIDGEPIYTKREIEILKGLKDKPTKDMLQLIYDTKLLVTRELTESEIKNPVTSIHMVAIRKAMGL